MSRWPQVLLNKSVYPHPVDHLQLIETHISWVVLTGTFAYKIKKPVNLGFLDFTTLEQRRHYCLRELELNRRFSKKLYLDVVPVTGSREYPVIDGDAEVIDYAVKMRQFDNSLLADSLARQHRLSDELVRKMAKTLASFHRELPAVDQATASGFAQRFFSAATQNFSQVREYPLPQEIEQALQACEKWTLSSYQQCLPLMRSRQREGYIKDCHGDCHLGNIAVIDGEVTLFDCIEFNDDFRIMDTMAEAAFLSMDLCARGLAEQSQRFLNDYLEYRGDYSALPLLDLFRCYYALVRAKVNLMQEPAAGHPGINRETHSEFYRYLALAQQFTTSKAPVMVLMHGYSGSGKSYLAERLAVQTGAIRIRSDVERKRLYGLLPEQSGDSVPELYSREASRRTFKRLLQQSATIMAAGFPCIVDATFLTESSRHPFVEYATGNNIPLLIVHCVASEEATVERLARREQSGRDPSDAGVDVYRRQKGSADTFTNEEQLHVLVIDTERGNGVESAVARLQQVAAQS